MIDPRQARFGQGVTSLALAVAFVLDARLAIPILATVLAGASLLGSGGSVYAWAWRAVVPRLGPPAELEEAAPPRFANALGCVFLTAASALLLVGLPSTAWALALVVAGLALLAAVTGLCVGCELYVATRRVLTRGRVARKIVVPRA